MAYIEIKDLSLSFENKKILDLISYRFEDGITVLYGESGAGKTTLLNTISGMLKEYNGSIVLSKNSTLGYCLQEDLLFNNLTVEENMYLKFVALKKKESDEVKTALAAFGIDSLLSCKVKTLSGGEKQRLKMAMMFLSNPDIILLDEPTAKLDDENINSILKVIEHVWKDKLILIVTHHRLPFSQPIKELHLKGGKLQ